MDIRKTKSGWVMTITNTVDGMLEQGGWNGREVLYTRESLRREGIDYDSDPESILCAGTISDYLYRMVEPDRVLRIGQKIA